MNAMPSVKATVSIREPLFEEAEALAREMKVSRSHLYECALQEFVLRRENKKLLERINVAYAEGPEPEEEAVLRGMRRRQRQRLEGEW
jgi:metal-responsive CopG/Arc/MetJ family transcriptional regulator